MHADAPEWLLVACHAIGVRQAEGAGWRSPRTVHPAELYLRVLRAFACTCVRI